MNLPASINAPLPLSYETAKTALAQCQEIDECKDWADKAAALASYARQSEDLELEKMAARIRARAMRRAGELLKQIDPGQGARDGKREEGDHLPLRSDAAKQAGMSEHQQKTAVRVASIPERDFAAQVESSNPPTLTELARQGTQKRDAKLDPETWLEGRAPEEFHKAMHFVALVEAYEKNLGKWNLNEVIGCLNDADRRELRTHISRIDATHDKIMTRI